MAKIKTRDMDREKQVYEMLPPEMLKPNPFNERLFRRNESNSADLKKSMLEKGFLANHPVQCFIKGKSLVIISGHRRWRAAMELGIDQVPVTIIPIVDESKIEKLMIEENLLRPQEGRRYSVIERYILALRLAYKFPEQRGGNRRSEDYRVNCERTQKKVGKNEWLSAVTEICLKYLSELSVITKHICQNLEKSHPELLGLQDYEQLQVIFNEGLSKDLNDLHLGNTTIRKVYCNYKSKKQLSVGSKKVSPSENKITAHIADSDYSPVPPLKNTGLALVEKLPNSSVVFFQGFKDFLAEGFVGHPNQVKAMLITSVTPPQNPISALQLVSKAAKLLLQTTEKRVTEIKKVEDKQTLLPFELGKP